MRLLLYLAIAAASLAQNPPSRVVGKILWDGALVAFEVVDGRMIVQGDLDIGPYDADRASEKGVRDSDVISSIHTALWPTGTIAYIVDADIPNPQRILDAVAIWNTKTPVRLVPRTNQTTYLRFQRNTVLGACFTNLNQAGGEQTIQVLDSCEAPILAHEIGHVAGLHHEQQRADRDYYVEILQQYLEKVRLSELTLAPGGSVPTGGYDYGSLMHYGRYFTQRTSKNSTIETFPPGIVIGEASTLSAGDTDSIARTYGVPPSATTIATDPPGLNVIVDGVTVTAPQSFNWTAGSVHTVDVSGPQAGSGAGIRYVFGRWSDNQPQSHSITASSFITVYTAAFVRQYRLQTGVSPAAAGTVSVSPSSPDGFYPDNASVTLTATPSSGFRFLNWTQRILVGYHGYSDNPVTFPMKTNLIYTAMFTSTPPVTVTTDPPDMQIVVDGTTMIGPVNLDPSTGQTHNLTVPAQIQNQWNTIRWIFTGWSDGSTQATRTLTVPSSLPATFTARYKVQYKLTTQLSGSGQIVASPPSADGFYDAGALVQLTATPAPNFKLSIWTGDLSGPAATQTLTMSDEMVVTAEFLRPFTLSATAILNAASYQFTPLSAGEIVTIFGLELGPATLTTAHVTAQGLLDTAVSGSRVFFDGIAAPIVYTWQNQIAAIVPYALAGKSSTQVQVEFNSQRTNTVTMPMGASAPGVFATSGNGLGPGAIFNQDGSLNTAANPAAKGSIVVLYLTGEGQTAPPGVDGKPTTGAAPKPAQPVSVRLGGPSGVTVSGSAILYAAGAPLATAGLMQINFIVPGTAPSGDVPLEVIVGGQTSPAWVTVSIQ